MKEREFYIPSSDGISRLRCMEWRPEGDITGVLQLSHGMIEHIERYRELGRYLTERGIVVYGHDHLGHGKTAGSREDLGYFGEDGASVCLIKDLRRLTAYGKKCYPGKKLFLLGHSMGSFFVRKYLTVYKDGPDGILLLGTGGQPLPLVAAAYLLSLWVTAVKGDRCRSILLHRLSLGNYNRKFHPAKTGHDWLSRDEKQVYLYEKDELCRFLFTAGAYRDLFRIIVDLTIRELSKKMRTDLPILFLSGTNDPVGGCGRGVRKVHRRYDRAGVKDLSLRFYQDARHEILNELNREEVFRDIDCWIEDRIS